MDYHDENDSPVLSIAIGDDESKTVVVTGVAQDADVQRVVVGPASGSAEEIVALDENMQELDVNESGFLALKSTKNGVTNYSLATQDGNSALTCKRINDAYSAKLYEILHRTTPVNVLSNLKLPSSTPGGALAALPKTLFELFSWGNRAVIRSLHAPNNGQVDGAIGKSLLSDPDTNLFWGDETTTLLFY